MSNEIVIRPAVEADWPQMWPIIQSVLHEGRTYSYPSATTEPEARALWMLERPWNTWVVDFPAPHGPRIAATCIWGPNRPGRGAHVATASFMVSDEFSGQGIARSLAEAVIADATAEGYRAMQFNAVVQSNAAAVHLWQKLGFTIIGTVPEAFHDADGNFVGLHVMHRFLSVDSQT